MAVVTPERNHSAVLRGLMDKKRHSWSLGECFTVELENNHHAGPDVMKVEEVPQDKGMIGEYGREICYATGQNGRYLLSPSLGWEVKNIVNDQAWDVIIEEAAHMHALVKARKLSPIAYYQAKHQMDLGLLSQYVGMARWRVKRHLKPAVFNKLPDRILQRYAEVFSLSIAELQTVPHTFSTEDIRKQ